MKVNFNGIYTNKLLLKSLKLAAKNGTLFSATASLFLSTAARPIAIMSTPKTDRENKKIACAKSLSSSIVGYLIMLASSLPVSKAIEKIDKNPLKYLKKETIKNLQGSSKFLNQSKIYSFASQIFKLGVGLIIAAPKSALTCVMIPFIAGVFPGQKSQKQESDSIKKSKVISFKGIYNKVSEKLAKGIGKIIDKKLFQNFAKKYYDTNYAQHITSLTDIVLTLSFVQQTAKNKKIEEKRKKPLIYNSIISTGLCLTGGYAVNSATNKSTEKFINKFRAINKNLPELEKYIEGIKIAKPVLILGAIYYMFIPVISTFLADRTEIKGKLEKPRLLK